MLVLGIESTCDETACAVVRDGKEILSNVVTSQIDLHEQFGGVVPELACRRHIDVIIPVIDEALKTANVELSDIDLIAVAHGPGLIGALLIGLHTAKGLALAHNIPFIGVNHVEAHLYASLMSMEKPIQFPCLGAVLSGGHTALILVEDVNRYYLISQTVDDAIGEAFDKVAKILDLPYPGGPQIEELAKHGNHLQYNFKGGNVKGRPLDFSFSGLKTSVLYAIKGQDCLDTVKSFKQSDKCNIAASFQHAALNDVIKKTLLAAKKYSCNEVIFGGGVTNNQTLRQLFKNLAPELTCHWPAVNLSLDNAAMIAGLGYHLFKSKGIGDSLELEPLTRIPFVPLENSQNNND
ncbi:MAG: tRNA (adenosine(37)-N6)-threonylcarbamoyltransferase complex transferase subunit TsaD [Parachlamydiaceae bacterium]|nr:tRNA (adenosine(37)-N6)-threonylcarbamoyltransferase complex transferase subunit TsaD [Parachlamydiaceae bacterium]